MEVLWFLPTGGDTRYMNAPASKRVSTFSYLKQVAQAVDELGYTGALLPTGPNCEDSWVVASSLLSVTQRMKFLIAVRPGLISPSVSARMATTFDRMSNGRLLLNVVTGGDPVDLAGSGLHLAHDERYDLTDEFLTVWRGVAAGEEVNFEGKHIHVKGGKSYFDNVQKPYPPLWFGGSSDAALRVAARHVDVYLTWGEPPAEVEKKLHAVRKIAAEYGRTLRFGIRLHVIVRDTEAEAWQAAEKLIANVDEAAIARQQALKARMDSVGQQRMDNLHGGSRDKLEISPNLWAGVGLLREGAATALVGDSKIVTARIKEYADLGIETFILSGYPHLEEAYRFAELVFPHLPLQAPETKNMTVSPFSQAVTSHSFPSEFTLVGKNQG